MLSFLYNYPDLGMLILRLALGAIFLVHGLPKLSGKMGGFMALIGVMEVVGALSVLLGLYAQLGALLIAIVMLGALYKKIVEWKAPFTSMEKLGWEFDLILLTASIAIMTIGVGAYSAEALWMV